MQQNQFFRGLKVIELASVLAGPAVGMFFAELGATVLKIENQSTGGDVTRRWKLPDEAEEKTYSAYYHSINWGKESILLDLKSPEHYQQLIEYIKTADVVITNFKPSSAQKMKLDYESLQPMNPRLIYANINAYGPHDSRPGFDAVIQAETGWLSMTGEAGRGPVKLPVALMDILTAHQLKEGILVALLHRERSGAGSEVQACLFATGVASLANQASNWLNAGHLPQRMGSQHPNIAPYGDILLSKNKQEILLSVGTEKQYQDLLDCLDLHSLKNDERFATNALRLANRKALIATLQMAAGAFSTMIFLNRCAAKGVPVAVIQNLKDLFDQPETDKLLLSSTDEKGNPIRVVKTVAFEVNSAPVDD